MWVWLLSFIIVVVGVLLLLLLILMVVNGFDFSDLNILMCICWVGIFSVVRVFWVVCMNGLGL